MSFIPLKSPPRGLVPGVALLMVGAICGSARATTYEVAPAGNDASSGLAAAPWKTLQKAALTVKPGDTVLINDGTYAGFRVRTSGTAAARITFKSKSKWGAKITSVNPSADADWVTVLSASYITIDGLEVSGSTRAGIGVRTLFDGTGADTRDNIVQNCFCHDNGLPSGGAHDGIFTGFALNFTAQDNVCDHNGEHGIYVSNSADNPIVRRNRCSNNRNCGIQLNADANTQVNGQGDGLISNWLVENNVIYGNGAGGGAGVNLDGDVNGVCRNNLIYSNTASGIALYGIDGAQASNHNLVVNNTIYDPNSPRGAIVLLDGANSNNAFNNILISGIGIDVGVVSGFTHDYNVVSSYSGAAATAHEKNATAAALFVAPGSNFRLAANSPALNAGVAAFGGANAPATDIENAARPAGAAFDIGCFESGASPQPTPTPTATPTATPTPEPTATPTPTPTPTAKPGTLRFSVAKTTVNEGAGTATITVQRVDGSDGAISVHYATVDGGSATPTTDYTATSGQIAFAAGDAAPKTFKVAIVNDSLIEAEETINLHLSAPVGGAVLDATLQNAVLAIADNDAADTTAPTVAFLRPINSAYTNNLNEIVGTAKDEGGAGLYRVTLQIIRLSDGLFWSGTAWGKDQIQLTTTLTDGRWVRSTGNPAGDLLPEGLYRLRAYAYDKAGNRGYSLITITVNKTRPLLTIENPAANANLQKLPVISGAASDDIGITRVAISIQRGSDGLFWSGTAWTSVAVALETTYQSGHWSRSSGNPPEFTAMNPQFPPGPCRVFARAYDRAGNSTALAHNFTLSASTTGVIEAPSGSGNLAELPRAEHFG